MDSACVYIHLYNTVLKNSEFINSFKPFNFIMKWVSKCFADQQPKSKNNSQ